MANAVMSLALDMEPKLRKTAANFLRGPHDPALDEEDLLQECYLKLHRHGHHYDSDKSAPNTFIYNVARNQCCTVIGRIGTESQPDGSTKKRLPPVPFSHLEDGAESVVDFHAASEYRVALRDAIARLLRYLWNRNRTTCEVVRSALRHHGDLRAVQQEVRMGYTAIRKHLDSAWASPPGAMLQGMMESRG